MVETDILTTLSKLPEPLKQEVLHYAEFLAEKYTKDADIQSTSQVQPSPKKRRAGILKGKIWMADDFDAPLEEFKDYM